MTLIELNHHRVFKEQETSVIANQFNPILQLAAARTPCLTSTIVQRLYNVDKMTLIKSNNEVHQ